MYVSRCHLESDPVCLSELPSVAPVPGGCGKVGVCGGQGRDNHTSLNSDSRIWENHKHLLSCYMTGASLIGSTTLRLALSVLQFWSLPPPSPLLFAVYHNFPEVAQSLSIEAKPELEFSLSQQKATVWEGVWRPGTLVLCKCTCLCYNQ